MATEKEIAAAKAAAAAQKAAAARAKAAADAAAKARSAAAKKAADAKAAAARKAALDAARKSAAAVKPVIDETSRLVKNVQNIVEPTPPPTDGSLTGDGTIPKGSMAPSFDVFKNIISVALGAKADEPWIKDLYSVAKKYLDDGTISPNDSMLPDLLLNDQNAPQSFKDRFKGIIDLRAKGARFIPSVADYIKAEKDFGTMFRNAGLKDLDNSNFFATLVANEVDYATASNMVSKVYQTIDNADAALKRELQVFFPGLQKSDLAKSLLLGGEAIDELSTKISTAEIKSEATARGIMGRLDAADLARRGLTRAEAAAGYEVVSQELNPLTRLTQIYDRSNAAKPEDVQTELESEALLGQQSKRKQRLVRQETANFAGSAGTVPTLASRARAGQF